MRSFNKKKLFCLLTSLIMKLKLAFSTCPNDTFMFDAMVNGRVDTMGLKLDVSLADIEELNTRAVAGEPDVSKVSYSAYPHIASQYQILDAGSALGNGVGPLVISKRRLYPDEVKHASVAIPGDHTTANMLFTIAFPDARNKRVYLFSEIEEAILGNEVDAGVIIHENRFTYERKGLLKVVDLGDYWEQQTGLPIPLGGIVIRRSLAPEVKLRISAILRASVEYALAHPGEAYPFVRRYAQSMEEEVMYQHIKLFVNKYSVSLGVTGRRAILELFDAAKMLGLIQDFGNDIFISSP